MFDIKYVSLLLSNLLSWFVLTLISTLIFLSKCVMRADRWSDFFSGLQWNALLCSQGLYEHAASVVDISTSVFAAFLVVMASDWRNHLRDQDLSWFTVWNSPPCWGNCDDWSLRQLDLLTFPSGCWHYRQDVTCTWHLYRVLRSQTPPW